MMHTASITSRTPPGGLLRDLTSTMSFFDSFFRLSTAASSAGRALSRSAWASSAIALASAAWAVASVSCWVTTVLVSSAAFLSLVMMTIMSSTSFWVCASTGCRSVSSLCITSTSLAVVCSLSSPTCSREAMVPISSFFSLSSLMKVVSSSR